MISAMRVMAVAAVMAGLTSAQQLPSCATNCVTEFTTGSQIGGCSSIDVVCICSSHTFISGIACCLASACDTADQDAATQYALTFCKAAGVTNLPTAVSCTSTALSTATTATSSTPTTGTVTTATSSVSSTQSSASSSASKASSSSASVSSQASSSTSSAATSATKNAGPHNVAGLGAGVLGGLAAAVAML